MSDVLDLIYPIGSVYLSVFQHPPEIGEWVFVAENQYIKFTTDNIAATIGGTQSHKHATKSHTLTTSEMPSHSHNFYPPGCRYGNPEAPGDTSSTFEDGRSYWFNPAGYSWSDRKAYDPPAVTNSQTSSPSSAKPGLSYSGSSGSHTHGDTGNTEPEPKHITIFMYYRIK